MSYYFKTCIFVLAAVVALFGADITYNVSYRNEAPRMSNTAIQQLVEGALDFELSENPYYKADVNVYTKLGGVSDYFVVYLFRSDIYLAVCYKVDIEQAKVVDVIKDYLEVDDREENEVCGTCPDEDVEAVFSAITEFQSAIQGAENAYNTATGAGINSVILLGSQESLTAIKNYLDCPKLKMWGRIGHGTSTMLVLGDGSRFSTSTINSVASDMEGKSFVFNSCYVHNEPFQGYMIDAGVYFYAGGDISLSVGKSEKVFARFMEKAIAQKMEMKQSMEEAMDEINYSGYGISGDDSGPPWYFGGGALTLTVSVPGGGEEWEQGNSYTIKWFSNVEGTVKIDLLKSGTVTKILSASTENDGEFSVDITKDFEIGNDYKVKIASIENDTILNESEENFSITEEFIITDYPYVQDFDDMDTGLTRPLSEKWEQLDGDDFDWIVLAGATPSQQYESTGPTGDHTSGTGNYTYIEASSPNNPSKKADMITPKFNLQSLKDPEMVFWAHMKSDSNTMGDIYVDIEVDGTWKNEVIHLTDDHGAEWFEVKQDLTDYVGERVRFKFRGITGESWCGDMCVDDFKILGNPTGITSTVNIALNYGFHYDGSRLTYHIPENSERKVSIKLYSIQGKLIRTLVKGQKAAGYHSISLHDDKTLPAGLYLCHMKTKEFTRTINILIQ